MIKDKHIRKKLLSTELASYAKDPNTLIVEEMGLCQGTSRIDIAVLNGHMTGYEIKSEADTLKRLSTQQHIYNQVLDYMVLVGYTEHLKSIDEHIPGWWGIIEVRKKTKGGLELQHLRMPQLNPEQDATALVQLLWKEETLSILSHRLNLSKGLASKSRHVLWQMLATNMDKSELSALVRETLKARRTWRAGL